MLLAATSPAIADDPVKAGPGGTSVAEHDLAVTVTGLRSGKGKVLACLASTPAAFPDCKGPGVARHLVVPAAKGTVELDFGPVPEGTYAISLFHDENGNGKLDTMVMIPREGYGFSRDAAVRFGPPRFAAAEFAIGNAPVRQTLKVRYIF